jgi:hypothetical protein
MDFGVYSSVFFHLQNKHDLRSRARLRVLLVVWREISCAVLGILDPEWTGP